MKGQGMVTSIDEQILRATKEIIVKFIEVGRVSPAGFGESFKEIYTAIDGTVKGAMIPAEIPDPPAAAPEVPAKQKKK
jgi:hypothetical protein